VGIEISVTILLAALWLGGLVYCLLGAFAARRFRDEAQAAREGVETPQATPQVTLLKPLSGRERGLEANLESFFLQDYPSYEILFAANRIDDPALEAVERLRAKYPERSVRVVMAADSPYPNAKVYSMDRMATLARGQVLVISDSDVCVTPGYLRAVTAPFSNSSLGRSVGVVTCLYRGAPGRSVWSRLEALGMSTRFMPGVLTAWALEDRSPAGMQFALGPTMAVRRTCLDAIGGFAAMSRYLADDFVLGKWASEAGYRVVLSHYVLDHHVLGESFAATFRHQLRWARSSRCSRPLGYIGELFTHPTALALLLIVCGLDWQTVNRAAAAAIVAMTLGLRWWVASAVGSGVLRDPESRRWWLLPAGDLLGFAVWLGGFTGRTIWWRGIAYRVGRDGKFEALLAASESASLVPVAENELAPASSDNIHGAGGQ